MKHGLRFLATAAITLTVCIAFMWGCKEDESGTGPTGPKTAFTPVTNLRAFSASIGSVGLTWTASVDAGHADFVEYQVTVKVGSAVNQSLTAAKTATSRLVAGLVEGTVYTFEVVGKASVSSQTFKDSDVRSVQWAPARRLTMEGTIPIDVYEIRSTAGGSGLQFFNSDSGRPVVKSITVGAGFQQKIDVLLDTTSAGVIILESAHRNPLRVGPARTTRFSTIDTPADTLDVGQDAPPATSTYTQEFVTIGSSAVATGKIFYAVSNDTNYVRIHVRRDPSSGTLLWGPSPNRRIRVQLSYQGVVGVPYAKPVRQPVASQQ